MALERSATGTALTNQSNNSNPSRSDRHQIINELISRVKRALAIVYYIDSDEALALFKDRITTLKTSFAKEFSILQTQPLSFTERVKNIWRYFSNKPSIDQKFNQLHKEVMSSLTKIEDISPLNAEFLSIQELGMRITEFREKIYKDPSNPELQSTLFTIKMDTLGRITPVLRKVLDFRFSSEKKNLLLQNIHEFILSYTDTDAADEIPTEENINIRDNFENLVEQFLRIINWGNREDFDQSVDDNIINKITTNFQYHKMDDLSVGESFEGLKIGSLWRITKELFKKVIIGKTTISTQNLPFLTTFLLLTHRFADVTSYNELSAQKIFPAASPLWRAIFSEVDLFIEENKGNPIFIEFLTRNSIHDPINKIAILQWMFFSEDTDRYTDDEHNLICDLNNEKYKILFFFKEKIAFYLYQLSNQ